MWTALSIAIDASLIILAFFLSDECINTRASLKKKKNRLSMRMWRADRVMGLPSFETFERGWYYNRAEGRVRYGIIT
jgi:hypothetical protein